MFLTLPSMEHDTQDELPDHIDGSMELILMEMELHAVLSQFELSLAERALKSVEEGFPVMLPGSFH